MPLHFETQTTMQCNVYVCYHTSEFSALDSWNCGIVFKIILGHFKIMPLVVKLEAGLSNNYLFIAMLL